MESTDVLLGVAEIAVTLAGFSSISAVFAARRPEHWTGIEVIRFWNLLAISLSVVFLALIPIWIGGFGWTEPTVWTVSSVVQAVWIGAYAAHMRLRYPWAFKDPGQADVRVAYASLVLSCALVGSQLLNAAGIGFTRSFTGYLTGLLGSLAAASIFFVLFLIKSGPRIRGPDTVDDGGR